MPPRSSEHLYGRTALVQPGVLDTTATDFFVLDNELRSDDFPTFERPNKPISGKLYSGIEFGVGKFPRSSNCLVDCVLNSRHGIIRSPKMVFASSEVVH